MVKDPGDLGAVHDEGVKVPARSRGHCREVGGIDVIHAHLEGLDLHAPGEKSSNGYSDAGLPAAGPVTGDHQGLHGMLRRTAPNSLSTISCTPRVRGWRSTSTITCR